MSPPFHLHLLGAPAVRPTGDAATSSLLTQPRRVALLAYLTLARPRGLHSRDTLVALLWPESDQAKGRQALRNALHGIRQALGGTVIITAGHELVGVDPTLIRCDVIDLENSLSDGRADGSPAPSGGELMEGFHVSGAPAFERWLDRERQRLRDDVKKAAQLADEDRRMRRAAVTARAEDAIHVLHLRGTYLFLRSAHGGDPDDLLRGRAFFEQALKLDPAFAPALAGLSNCLAAGAARDVWRPFEPTFDQAIELSRKALAIDASLAVPHVHFGVKAMYLDDDWETARQELERAVALDPRYPEARRFLGIYYGTVGRWRDAVAEMGEAVRLEPQMAIFRNTLADAYMAMGEYESAIRELRAALDADPRYRAARERLVRCCERRRRYAEAIGERRLLGPEAQGGAFGDAFAQDGPAGYRRQRAIELKGLIARIQATLAKPPERASDILNAPELRLALACADLQDWKGARRWRDRACAQRPGRRPWFDSRPELARARQAG